MSFSDLVRVCDGDEYRNYPENVIYNETLRPYHLRSLKDRLAADALRLFCRDGSAKLNLLRVDKGQRVIETSHCINLLSLKQQIPCSASQNKDLLVCQLAFIEAHSSRDVLDISKDMLLWLLSIHQATPTFLEFVFPFGEQIVDHDFHFSAFRNDTCLSPGVSRGHYPEMLRSGQDFQLCYNLKGIEKKPQDPWGWSARQAAVFHSFDVGTGQANWIVIKANQIIRNRMGELLGRALQKKPGMYDQLSAKFANTLDCHFVLIDWCAENWRWYIKYFEEQLETNTTRALLYKPAGGLSKEDFAHSGGPSIPQPLVFRNTRTQTWTGRIFRTSTSTSNRPTQPPIALPPVVPLAARATVVYEDPDELPPEFEAANGQIDTADPNSRIRIDELQNAQYLETKASEASLILKSNIGVLSAAISHYEEVEKEVASSQLLDQLFKNDLQLQVSRFAKHIKQVIGDLENHLARMDTISKLATDRKTLLYSLVDYQNMQANESFARKAQESAVRMEDMTKDMQNLTRKTAVETVLMRIITVVTVLFLPATFVSTMMSANIVDFKPKDHSITGGSTSLGALKFFLCLTLTLMVATFGTGFVFYVWEVNHSPQPNDDKRTA